ncbi:hypothetical protein [Paraburkholderia azotifigens]|uniref:Uncharacterized protein n=1 Tax=Paraburkholderia azotifigens TaxID=2057004 RepID=A0ABU9R2N3_9BURK|nr:hypothetical protein [Paraburkholderia azotifigens]
MTTNIKYREQDGNADSSVIDEVGVDHLPGQISQCLNCGFFAEGDFRPSARKFSIDT